MNCNVKRLSREDYPHRAALTEKMHDTSHFSQISREFFLRNAKLHVEESKLQKIGWIFLSYSHLQGL